MANYSDDFNEEVVNKYFKLLSLITTADRPFIQLLVSSFQTVLPIFMQNLCKLILYICKIITQSVCNIFTQSVRKIFANSFCIYAKYSLHLYAK